MISQRKYAEHRKRNGLPGGSHTAVRNAIREGRLAGAVDGDGQITDVQLADELWSANTLSDRVPLSGPTASAVTATDLHIARARREMALAQIAEIELAALQGRYIDTHQARADVDELITTARTQLLGVHSRCAQRDRTLTHAQIALIDRQIREVLSELADGVRRRFGKSKQGANDD